MLYYNRAIHAFNILIISSVKHDLLEINLKYLIKYRYVTMELNLIDS